MDDRARAYMREYMRVYQPRRYRERMEYAREKLGGACVSCGSTENLEFDHVDPSTRVSKISQAVNWSLERFDAELAKCQLLCKDHHIEKSMIEDDVRTGCSSTTLTR